MASEVTTKTSVSSGELIRLGGEYWTCCKCTFSNKSMTLACYACGNERSNDPVSNEWQCPECTLVNSIDRLACIACDYPSVRVVRRAENVISVAPVSAVRELIKDDSVLDHTREDTSMVVDNDLKRVRSLHTSGPLWIVHQLPWPVTYIHSSLPLIIAIGRSLKTTARAASELDRTLIDDAMGLLTSIYQDYVRIDAVIPTAAVTTQAKFCPAAEAGATCLSCFEDFNDEVMPCLVKHCGHRDFCITCMLGHIRAKIDDGRVTPWITCPSSGCTSIVSLQVLLDVLTITHDRDHLLLRLTLSIARKQIVRNEAFVVCQTYLCVGGFILLEEDKTTIVDKQRTRPIQSVCKVCNTSQMVQRPGTLDSVFQSMQANGSLKPCPQCKQLHMKEMGVCNLITCDKCGIFWNFASGLQASSLAELKTLARSTNTLWHPADLAYQLKLERDNPAEFRALIERNGGKFDPKYRRGT